jgi:copper homeostasis protein
MLIEVCAFSLEACLIADRAGADRIELCAGPAEGGLTPSAGLLTLARQQCRLPIHAMIRPRGGDFCYTETELAVMRADIDLARQLGADGLVLGVLQPDGAIDAARMRELIDLARPLPVTFHRAFDLCRDPHEALDTLMQLGVRRLLTSGQQPTADAGLSLLRDLVKQANGRIEIMAGSGVNAGNAGLLAQTGVDALHLSGRSTKPGPMIYRKSGLSMAASVPGAYERAEADVDRIGAVVRAVKP